ncbi:MAG: type II toxin-antitoxin system PemK/MazF family toxin [Symploca sp. SIO3C6]|nr:type II toxin-antitoxin system PemK/MazF family toxin [Symploca sp. SIO3C6]
MTTKTKNNKYYCQIQFKGKLQSAILSQLRLWDSKRLNNKIGQLHEKQFNTVRAALKQLL